MLEMSTMMPRTKHFVLHLRIWEDDAAAIIEYFFAYLRGSRFWYGLCFVVGKSTLMPRTKYFVLSLCIWEDDDAAMEYFVCE